MMRKRNNNMRNNRDGRNDGGHRNNGGGRRYQNNGGSNRGANDSQNLQRQKHHATQQLGKYNDLARNAQMGGDRADVEYYLQHVDHYTRVLADIAVIEAERFSHHREQFAQHGEQQQEGTQQQDGNEQAAHGNDAQPEAQHQPQPRQPRQRQPRSHYSPPLEERLAMAEASSGGENPASAPSEASSSIPAEIPLPSLPAI